MGSSLSSGGLPSPRGVGVLARGPTGVAVACVRALGAGDLSATAVLLPDMKVKSRHHLRSDEIKSLRARIEEGTGVAITGDAFEVVELEGSTFDLVLVDGEPLVMYVDDEPFLTVRGANANELTSGVVTVDAGAVSFVSNGADVMRPGIVAADEDIEAGELVAIAEETHGKVLGIGRALVAGGDMLGDSGKVVESVHYVGDDLYGFTP